MIPGLASVLTSRRLRLLAAVLGLVAGEAALLRAADPPLPPPTRPAVELFLELLQAPPARRTALLAAKSPAARDLILDRLREYESLDPARREERLVQLHLAQFRYHLSQLLRAPGDRRDDLLRRCPESSQPLLAERLSAWERLSPEDRAALLDSDESLHFFVRHQSAGPDRLQAVLQTVPVAARAEVERQYGRWSGLPAAERARRAAAFQRFFDLNPAERVRAVDTLPEADRRLMERTLAQFAALPPEQQSRCVEGYGRLAELTPEERADFLRNAQRWQAMTPLERAAWRRLVNPVPPPPPLPTAVALPAVTNR